jgi:transcriptional regulator with XRE-family HTH domain
VTGVQGVGHDALRLTTGEKIRLRRESRGLTRPVLAGLVGRSPDWLKKIETGVRPLNSLTMLIALARALRVADLSELTADNCDAPLSAWDTDAHPVVPSIREAMREASFASLLGKDTASVVPAGELAARVRRLWLLWHRSPKQRTDVGAELPDLIRQAHTSLRAADGLDRRQCAAAAGDLYRLVQRLLAHICEPELHALAVERGRALSEQADSPLSLAQATWSSAVGLCASGHYDAAAELADRGSALLLSSCRDAVPPTYLGMIGALQLEAAAAHGLAGREGDAYRNLDAAGATASRLPDGQWHLPSAFSGTNVMVLSVIVGVSLRRPGEALVQADRIRWSSSTSVVRRSRLLLERAQAHADRREFVDAVTSLRASAAVSREAVALIPWARTLAAEVAERVPPRHRADAARMKALLSTPA